MDKQKSIKPMKVYLAVDGSEGARLAVELVGDLPLPEGSLVTLLAVQSPKQNHGRAALFSSLERDQAYLQDKGVQVLTGLLHGHPAEEITNFAQKHQPDMIALGAQGRHATFGVLLGGIAQQIVEYAIRPVLVVRPPYSGIKRILLVTDGSISSNKAVNFIANFPLPEDVNVQVMHVLPPLPAPAIESESLELGINDVPSTASFEVEETIQKQVDVESQDAEDLLNNTLAILEDAGINASSVLVRGKAATEIIKYVKENNVDLVVAGSRGLSRVRGWLMGSVSRKLVHYADCSVLIARGENKE